MTPNALADAILYEASFQLWKASSEGADDPIWRETWAMRSPEERVALVQKDRSAAASLAASVAARASARAAARARTPGGGPGYLNIKREW
jgi:hypothetical protein